jgi:hypothetical protein
MSLSRRSLVLGAAGTGLALVGGAGAWRVTRLPATASAPWRLGEAPADARLDALRHAILAPNPHNRQPWLMRLVGKDEVVVSCDLDRRLPETDPFDRQIVIGFGGFLELARIAAAERGFRVEAALFPEGEPQPRLDGRPIASLRFVPDASAPRDPLFAQIPARRSTKEPYDLARPVSADALAAVARAAGATTQGTSDRDRVAALRAVALQAGGIEASTSRTHKESVDLMRIGHREIDASPDGIDLDGPLIEGLKLAGGISREQMLDPSSTAFKAGMDRNLAVYGSVPAYLWIKTAGNGRLDQLAAGRAYVRANLQATALGLSMHPASQALQEFPEMREPHAAIHRLLADGTGERVQMLARIGYGPSVPPSPRWPLETRIVTA